MPTLRRRRADDAAARLQRLREKNREDGIEHLRRDVSEQAREGQQECVAREPREVSRAGWSLHGWDALTRNRTAP
jgi:hypothetical protein